LLQEGGGGGEEMAPPSGIAGWNPRTHGYTVGISFGIVMPFAALISRGFRVGAPLNEATFEHVSSHVPCGAVSCLAARYLLFAEWC
jgi:hypothetical protein